MFYTYSEVTKKLKSNYQLKKAIQNGELYKIKPGWYSDTNTTFALSDVFLKRDDTIMTLQSAFYYHGVTDYIPESTYVATPRNAYPIQNREIKQIFMSTKFHSIGVKTVVDHGVQVRVYDLERSLIELIRYETKLPFEEYHHVLRKFREINAQLDFNKLVKYARYFRSYKKIMKVVQNSIL